MPSLQIPEAPKISHDETAKPEQISLTTRTPREAIAQLKQQSFRIHDTVRVLALPPPDW